MARAPHPVQFGTGTLFAMMLSTTVLAAAAHYGAGFILSLTTLIYGGLLIRLYTRGNQPHALQQHLLLAGGLLLCLAAWLPIDDDRSRVGWQVAWSVIQPMTRAIWNSSLFTEPQLALAWTALVLTHIGALVLPLWCLALPRPARPTVSMLITGLTATTWWAYWTQLQPIVHLGGPATTLWLLGLTLLAIARWIPLDRTWPAATALTQPNVR